MARKKGIHYSERLGRFFQDGDELTRDEATAVLSQNAGRDVDPKKLFDLVRAGVAHPRYLSPRKLLYQYSEIKDYVVAAHPGRRAASSPSAVAQRQRLYRERRAAGIPVDSRKNPRKPKKMATSLVG